MNREMRRLFKKYESTVDIEKESWDNVPQLITNPDLFVKKKQNNKKKKRKKK